jgi:signal transduction histidine kinase
MAKLSDMAHTIEQKFISEAIQSNPSELRRARFMLVILGGSGISVLILIYISMTTSDNPRWVDTVLLLGHLVVCSSIFAIKFTDTMIWPTRMVALLGAVQLVVAAGVSGGPDSNVLYALPLLPIFLSALVDKRTNVIATLIVLIGIGAIFFVDLTVAPFPDVTNSVFETMSTLFWIMVWSLGIAVYSQHQANRLLKVAEKELEQRKVAQEDLARVSESKDRFLAYMSHEIRNPLTAIVGAAELLSMQKMKAEHPRYLESLRNSANSLRELVDTVLDFSQIDSDRMLFDLSPLPLQPFLTDVTSQFSAAAEASGLRLSCEIAPGSPRAVIANETRLKQVLSNILSNAIKFSDPGSIVHLRVEPNSESREGARFVVEDSGLGIRLEDQTKIFEPYQRSHEGLAHQGTGLGLPIAQVLLEKMGTTLNVDSELGKGSRFYFILASDAGLPTANANATEDAPITLKGKTVLVAEDNAQAAVVVLGMLSAMGCKVWHARDGKEAISLYTEFNPDCVLMDIQMPLINGIEATRAIREIERSKGGKPAFVLAITGELNQQAVTETGGFDGLLQKPFSPPDLLKVISSGM